MLLTQCKKFLAAAALATAALAGAAPAADDAAQTHWEWAGWGGGGYFWSAAATDDPQVFYLGGDVVGAYNPTCDFYWVTFDIKPA